MLPLIPLLIGPNPLLLALLSGSLVSEVAVGARVRVGEISWPAALAAGLPVWVLTDWLYWLAGRRWGDRALVRMLSRGDSEQARRRADRAERVVRRFGAWGVLVAKFLPVPAQVVYAAAGTAGMRLPVFLALNFLGTLMIVTVVVSLGFTVGRRANDVIESFQQYALLTTVVVVALVVVALVVRRRRGQRPG